MNALPELPEGQKTSPVHTGLFLWNAQSNQSHSLCFKTMPSDRTYIPGVLAKRSGEKIWNHATLYADELGIQRTTLNAVSRWVRELVAFFYAFERSQAKADFWILCLLFASQTFVPASPFWRPQRGSLARPHSDEQSLLGRNSLFQTWYKIKLLC